MTITYGTDYTCVHGEPVDDCAACPTEPDSWRPIDLGPFIRGEVQRPEPTVGLARSDGLRLLYPGREHAVVGEMEAGKSWFALACVANEICSANPVVYIHFEESDPSDTIERLLALDVTAADLLKMLRFVGPERQVTAEALAALLDPAPSLVVFDGVNEAMSLHGWGIRDEDGAAAFRRHLVMPCARKGAATLACDHVVKDAERRGRNAIGSVHKGNGLSGSLIWLENAEPFGRRQRGRSHVFVTKDRPGHLRRHGRQTKMPGKTYMGELVVDDTRKWTEWLELRFCAPKGQAAADADTGASGAMDADPLREIDDQVLAVVRSIIGMGKEANLRTVRGAARLGKDKIDDGLARLTLAGTLDEARGARGARVFTVAQEHSSDGAE